MLLVVKSGGRSSSTPLPEVKSGISSISFFGVSGTETGEDVSGPQYGGGGHDSKHYSIITKCKEVSIEGDGKSKSGYSEARIGSNVLPVGTSGTATGYFYNSLPKGL